jgi:hypothetical protein
MVIWGPTRPKSAAKVVPHLFVLSSCTTRPGLISIAGIYETIREQCNTHLTSTISCAPGFSMYTGRLVTLAWLPLLRARGGGCKPGGSADGRENAVHGGAYAEPVGACEFIIDSRYKIWRWRFRLAHIPHVMARLMQITTSTCIKVLE